MDARVASQKPNKLLVNSRKLHKWLMAFIGIQLFIWSLTGVYMVLPSIHYIHGDHLLKQSQPHLQSAQAQISFSQVLRQYPNAQNIQLGWLGDQAVYHFTVADASFNPAKRYMLDASSGIALDPLTKEQVIALVPQLLNTNELSIDESVDANISDIELLTSNVPSEIGSRGLPLWQVTLDTWDNTTLYITQNSGQVTYIRHHAWRLFDAFWRLHIMDYTEGEDISNKLLAFSSLITFIAIFSGLILLCFRMFAKTSFLKIKTLRYDATDNALDALITPSAIKQSPIEPASTEQASAKVTTSHNTNSFTWLAKQSHKWLALLVFVQLLLWVISGFILGRLDHSLAGGDLTFEKQNTNANVPTIFVDKNGHSLVDINRVLLAVSNAESVKLVPLLDTWVYQVQHSAGRHAYWPSQYSLIDAFSGERVEINQNMAEELALQSYRDAKQLTQPLSDTSLLHAAGSILPKEQNPIWRVAIDDPFGTQVLIRASTGEVLAHFNELTSWRNLLLKLHFMDYANEGSFNNVFIKLFALFTLLLSLSGLAWLYQLVKDRQLSWSKLLSRSSRKHVVTVHISEETTLDLRLNPNDTLLDGLLNNDINIESICAGGGMCGKCVCQVHAPKQNKLRATQAELNLLSKQQLDQNWRLACQHRVKRVKAIRLKS